MEYERLGEREEDLWYCPRCTATELPFAEASFGAEDLHTSLLSHTDVESNQSIDDEARSCFDRCGANLVIAHLNIRSKT